MFRPNLTCFVLIYLFVFLCVFAFSFQTIIILNICLCLIHYENADFDHFAINQICFLSNSILINLLVK